MTTLELERQKSLPTLVRELLADANELMREELRLAQAETNEKLDLLVRNLAYIGVGIAFAAAAVFFLASAVNRGLTVLIAQALSPEIALWLAPLLLALALAATAWSLVRKGTSTLRRQTLLPTRTRDSLEEDKQWLKSRLS
jgi:uncharacterized membrane protein YqjE